MRLALLTKGAELDSSQRLIAAAEKRGLETVVCPILTLRIELTARGVELYSEGRPLPRLDRVIPRIGTFMSGLALQTLEELESVGVPSLNAAAAIRRARHKFGSLAHLGRAGFRVPETTLVQDLNQVEAAVARLGTPLLIKPVTGNQGRGLVVANTPASAISMTQTLLELRRELILQRLYTSSTGGPPVDSRVLVVGDRAFGVLRRRPREGEFRANLHRGGIAEAAPLDHSLRAESLRAARTLGLNVAGVDWIETEDGLRLLEVNSSPGLTGIETTLEVDIAGAIVDHLIAETGRKPGDSTG